MALNFVIDGPLRPGGYGDLFSAHRAETGERVVVKRLRDFHLPDVRRGFLREVRTLSLGLPGWVRLLDSDLSAVPPYYVMPYLGGSLKSHAGGLTSDQLRTVAVELSTALAAAHARLIFHGDVKPDNVLVSWDGHLRVADPLGNGPGCTMLFSENRGGTPGYWAPEVRNGAPIHPGGDVYSLGATLYELSTGRRPQDGQNLDPGPSTDPGIREVIVACCSNDPALRPAMRDIDRLLRGERWGDVLAQRQQREQLVCACVLGGVAILAVMALAECHGRA